MKRYILFLLYLIITTSSFGQQLNVFCTGPDKKNGKPLRGVTLYSFDLGKKAELAAKKLRGYEEDITDYVDMQDTGDDGGTSLQCKNNWFLLVDARGIKINLFDGAENVAVEFDTVYVIKVKDVLIDFDAHIVVPINLKNKVTVMTEVPAFGSPSMPIGGDPIPERHGDYATVRKEIDIDPKHSRSNARFVVSPRVILPQRNDSLVWYLTPDVIDGQEYEKQLFARRGYDWHNDRLHEFHHDSVLHMKDNRGERFLYMATFGPMKPNLIYKVIGDCWYEDFHSIYHRDSVLISDGNFREPMRFLNWDDAKKAVPIVPELYSRRAYAEAMSYPMDFHMEFEKGSAVLNMTDSLTAAEWNRLYSWLKTYAQDVNSEISSVTVTAYSSPEGRYDRNKQLSRERTVWMVNKLKTAFPSVSGVIFSGEYDRTDNIVPWSTVADTLEALPGRHVADYAASIRDIVERKGSFDAQQEAIQANSEMWKYINDSVLKRVRRVEIVAEVITKRVLEKEEIMEKYQNDSNFHNGIGLMAYQYYILMNELYAREDWDGLYTIARAAYDSEVTREFGTTRMNAVPFEECSVKEQENARRKAEEDGKPIPKYLLHSEYCDRPYPLAGYYMANCLLHMNRYDTELLRPFLDDGIMNRNFQHVYNDPAIVVLQVLMYCVKQQFHEANKLIMKYSLKNNEQFKKLCMFVSCLAGNYKYDEEVRNYVASTSPMNRAVILAAMEEFEKALIVLKSEEIPQDDPRVNYLRAICKFQSLRPEQKSSRRQYYMSSALYNPYDEEESLDDESNGSFAAPMLEALRANPNNVEYLKTDGYFNNAYRQLVFYFWKRLNDGLEKKDIASEYDSLVKKYYIQEKK